MWSQILVLTPGSSWNPTKRLLLHPLKNACFLSEPFLMSEVPLWLTLKAAHASSHVSSSWLQLPLRVGHVWRDKWTTLSGPLSRAGRRSNECFPGCCSGLELPRIGDKEHPVQPLVRHDLRPGVINQESDPRWGQPRGKWMVSSVNSHTNATPKW